MATQDDINNQIESYQSSLKTLVESAESQLVMQGSFDIVNTIYDPTANLAGAEIIEKFAAQLALTDEYWANNIIFDPDKLTFKAQGKIGTDILYPIAPPPMRTGSYSNDIVPISDKNIDGYIFPELATYNRPIWQHWLVTQDDILTPLARMVDELAYINYVHEDQYTQQQDAHDAFDESNRRVGGKGVTFPNSLASAGASQFLRKQIIETSKRARTIWRDLAEKISNQLEKSIESLLERINTSTTYNQQHGLMCKKLADTFIALQGLTNDVAIKTFLANEEQARFEITNAFVYTHAVYNAMVMSRMSILENKMQSVMAKWDAESQRIKLEVAALATNTEMYSRESKFYIAEYTTQLKSLYDGLSNDIQEYEASYKLNSAGLEKEFTQIVSLLEMASQAVVNVITARA